MFKRTYFMSAVKPHDDGNLSYSFHACSASVRSFFADQEKIYKEMSRHIEEKMKDKPGKALQIVAFNKI